MKPEYRLLLVLLVGLGTTASATIYKFIDDQGRTVYTDTPVKGAQAIDIGEAPRAAAPERPAAARPLAHASALNRQASAAAPAAAEAAAAMPRQVLSFATRDAVPDLRCAPQATPARRDAPPAASRPLPAWLGNAASRPVRLAVWGDSHMVGDGFVGELARSIESHGLRVGQSMVPLGFTQSGATQFIRAACAPAVEWDAVPAYKSAQPVPVGPSLLTLYSTAAGSRLALDLRDRLGARHHDRLVLRYTPLKSGTVLAVSVDDGEEQVVRLYGDAVPGGRLAELVIQGSGPLSVVRVRVAGGTLALQALLLPPREAGTASLDVFGLKSSTVQGWSLAEPRVMQSALSGVAYDAVILAYGTNEGAAPYFHRDTYANDLRAALAAVRRVFPTQACILVGPPDRGVASAGRPASQAPHAMTYAVRHQEIAQVQAEVARGFRCAFWDWQAAMGGPGSSYRWADMQPPLMQRDLTHLTADGYRRAGLAFADALGLGRGRP